MRINPDEKKTHLENLNLINGMEYIVMQTASLVPLPLALSHSSTKAKAIYK